MTLPTRLAFVDLETTGATATADRITEIGIVEVDESGANEWSTLINPEKWISEFISSLTGITNQMVAHAPTFAQVATELQKRLVGRIFIAHNARFDHAFLKNEFKRVGVEFAPTVLCTVQLSRKLFPGFSHHNLDALIERHHLVVTERHRALGDARLIWQFWQVIHATLAVEEIKGAVKQLTRRPTLPAHLDATLIDRLPTTHGVYLFYGENNLPLYIGKANDLRRRVLSHFSNDHRSSRELSLSQQTRRVDWIQTPGEIGALLKESQLIKRLSPIHNRQLRRSEKLCAWRLIEKDGMVHIDLAQGDDLFFDQDDNLYGLYVDAKKAHDALRHLAEAHTLCAVLLGLEKVKQGKPCFASQVKRCSGACVGLESLAAHDARLRAALEPLQLQRWPFRGAIGIREGDALHIIDGWTYLGTATSENEIHDLISHSYPNFDRDVYRILNRRLGSLGQRLVLLGKRD